MGPKYARPCFCLSEALDLSDFREQISLTFSYFKLGQEHCPIPTERDGGPPFDGSGSNHHPFSSHLHWLQCSSFWFTPLTITADSSSLSPTTIFTWGTHMTACLGQTL